MPHVLVRDLEPDVVEKLKHRARTNGRSLAAEVRTILRQAATHGVEDTRARVDRIRAQFAGREFGDSADLIREDRDR